MARLDACVPRKRKDDKTFWVKIGSIWTKDDGTVSIELDALPLPDNEGRCVIKGFAPRDNNQNKPKENNSGGMSDFENDIPF